MPSLRPYPSYKDTDLPWLGQVPANWEVLHLRRVVDKFVDYRGHTPEKVDDGIPLITARNIKNGKIDWELSQEYIPEDLYDEWMVRGFPEKGDVLVTMEAPLGETAQIVETHIALAQRIVLLKADKTKIKNDYLKYFLVSTAGQGELWSRATGSTAIGIKASHLKEIMTLVPPLPEQQAIAAYLDRQTAKIDALIARKQRLLDLLAEQRAALISQAVTKGLNPDVRMKDSGVAWLGQVPSHWEVEKNKHIYREVDDRSEYGDEELLTVSHITGVTTRAEKEVNMFMAETLEGYKRCRAGDLAINTMWAWMGALGISSIDGIVSPSYNVYRFRKQNDFITKYIDYLYRTPQHIAEINRYSKGVWSSRLRLYPDEFFMMSTPKPPYEEQVQIVEHLDKALEKMDRLAAKVEDAIELQREYRAALISSVVTGKVQVKDEVGMMKDE